MLGQFQQVLQDIDDALTDKKVTFNEQIQEHSLSKEFELGDLSPFIDLNGPKEFEIKSPFDNIFVPVLNDVSAQEYDTGIDLQATLDFEIHGELEPSGIESQVLDEFVPTEDQSFLNQDSVNDGDSVHDDDSVIGPVSDPELFQQTPSTNRQISMDMTPGSFFAERSGHLGGLGTNNGHRPIWYTPQKDEHGNIIDLISTPHERIEKGGQTPAGRRKVRDPLYQPAFPSQLSKAVQNESDSLDDKRQTSQLDLNQGSSDWPQSQIRYEDTLSLQEPSPERPLDYLIPLLPKRPLKKKLPTTFNLDMGSKKQLLIAFHNLDSVQQHFSIVSVGQCMMPDNIPVQDTIFKFSLMKGKVEAQDILELSIQFVPLLSTTYSQRFHIKYSGQVTTLILNATSRSPKKERIVDHSLIESAMKLSLRDFQSNTPSSQQSVKERLQQSVREDKMRASLREDKMGESGREDKMRGSLREERLGQSTGDRLKQSMTNLEKVDKMQLLQRLLKSSTSGPKPVPPIDFQPLKLGEMASMDLKICNPDTKPMQITLRISGPFRLPTRKLNLAPRTFVPVPLVFCPTKPGTWREQLTMKQGPHTIRVSVTGICHSKI
ncbi:hypothetical protein EDD86DRAFT_211677 [Gorgonomyces haynaldii]|nr:hypothetical protein EDD86DRAFT_211677 [Gorgonomyces haynaldii]